MPSRTMEPVKLVGGDSREETRVAELTASSHHGANNNVQPSEYGEANGEIILCLTQVADY